MIKSLAFLILAMLISAPAFGETLAPMFQEAAETWGVPAALTQAIARVESGMSPWSLNIEGEGYKFDSKEEAVAKAQEARAAGRSFDSGVMQVNNQWLKKYGIPLEAAFDPLANITLGSWILKREIDRHGLNWEAVAAYHSPNPGQGRKYAEMVKKALDQGSVKSPDPETVRKPDVQQKADYAPLVVLRRDQQIATRKMDQPGKDEGFVKRPHRSEDSRDAD
jgi:soluble lytic murein transglycosylase-like protein